MRRDRLTHEKFEKMKNNTKKNHHHPAAKDASARDIEEHN